MYLAVYRYQATGVFGYAGYAGFRQIFSAGSPVLRSPPVYITGTGFSLVSEYDRDTTLVPGFTSREIREEKGGAVARMRWEGGSMYTLQFRDEEYILEERGGKHLVFLGSRKVAELKSAAGGVPSPVGEELAGYDPELAYELMAEDSLGEELVTIIGTLPLLRFAL